MDKGVSPVIAVVLLVAIAVIAAVGVWYWVGGLASKPAGVDTVQQSFTIEQCIIANGTVRVRNTGGVTIDIEEVPVYDGISQVGHLDFTTAGEANETLGAYEVAFIDFVNTTTITQGVTYEVVHGQLPSVFFTCN